MCQQIREHGNRDTIQVEMRTAILELQGKVKKLENAKPPAPAKTVTKKKKK